MVENNGTDPAVNVTVRDFLPVAPRTSRPRTRSRESERLPVPSPWPARRQLQRRHDPGVPAHRHISVKMFSPDSPGHVHQPGHRRPRQHIPEGNETTTRRPRPRSNAGAGFIDLTIAKCDDATSPAASRRRRPRRRTPVRVHLLIQVDEQRDRPGVQGRRAGRPAGQHDLRVRVGRHDPERRLHLHAAAPSSPAPAAPSTAPPT